MCNLVRQCIHNKTLHNKTFRIIFLMTIVFNF
eukprot:UN03449